MMSQSRSALLVIPGPPVGKARPRFTRNGKPYTPAATAAQEQAIAWAAKDAATGLAAQGWTLTSKAVSLTVRLYLRIPRSYPKKWRERAAAGLIWPTGKPDADNGLKLAQDSLNRIAWEDDGQVVRATVEKRYDEQPRTEIVIEELGEKKT